MKCGAQTALGIGAGYLLGRTKKLRLAFMLGALGASGRLPGAPGELLQEGTKVLGASPEVTKIVDDVRGKLVEAGKAAALAAVNQQIESLTNRLHARAEMLRAGEEVASRVPGRKSADDEDTGSEDDYDDAEDEESEESEDDESAADDDSAEDAAEESEGEDESDEEDDEPPRRRPVVARRTARRRTEDADEADEKRPARPRSSRRTTERSGASARRARR